MNRAKRSDMVSYFETALAVLAIVAAVLNGNRDEGRATCDLDPSKWSDCRVRFAPA
jgi:hypothetical protein